jgi:hypothetical protein
LKGFWKLEGLAANGFSALTFWKGFKIGSEDLKGFLNSVESGLKW